MSEEQQIVPPQRGARAAQRFLQVLFRLECGIAVFFLCLSAAALLADIFTRELFQFGLFGSLRVAVYSTAIAALIGFPIAIATGSHIRVTALDALVPRSWEPALGRVANVVSAAICIFFVYWAAFYVAQTRDFGETDPSLAILVWPIQSVLVWMFLSGAVRYIIYALFPALQPQEAEAAA
ncbi:TRAP transporter small permease [Neorhizobium sp. DT-125]|uniref:TRAP transporter small permease n=1 Tax=Neorhizobium sp. DT-125 TaxID=3396163 RepID=UPI003F1C69B0